MESLGCVELLVQNGADVNCQVEDHWTPLMDCAGIGDLNAAQYLLEQKADTRYRVPGKCLFKDGRGCSVLGHDQEGD
jgi:ankyrin repeat protein